MTLLRGRRRTKQRHKKTINPWALLRPMCWMVGHAYRPVYPGDVWARFHYTCDRCLAESYPRG